MRSALGCVCALVLVSGCDDSKPATLRVNPASLALRPLETVQLQVMAVRPDGSEEDVSARAAITSIEPVIAEVAGGQIIGLAAGQTQLRVEFRAIAASVDVTVSDRRLLSLSIDPKQLRAPPGGQAGFELLGKYSDGTVEDVGARAE